MEGLAPPLELLIVVKSALECGESVRTGIKKFLTSNQSEFAQIVSRWLFAMDQNAKPQDIVKSLSSSHRQALLRVLEQGLRGQTIMGLLVELEKEINDACAREIEQFIALLPIKLLVPLLLFQFPAYLILLLGPLIKQFLGAF
jgi:hypothetical protein